MKLNKDNGVCAPIGFKANGLHAGIRKNKSKKDLSLIVSDCISITSSCYTLNKVKGAPILVTQQHLNNSEAQAIIINSGNANTCNHNGVEIANKMCTLVAQQCHIPVNDVVVASTGVIGQELSIDPIKNSMEDLVSGLHRSKSLDACEGIMTTDTFPKQCCVSFELAGVECTIGAMAKGSGMIHPNMATLLGFITSDVSIAKELINELLKEVCDETFNMISVDGDTSTNDMITLMCNGLAKNPTITTKTEDYYTFKQHLLDVCTYLSTMIAKDGEGATKLLTCEVSHAVDVINARKVAKSVIASSLVKSAMFGCDANWGRILCAIGYSEAEYNEHTIDVTFTSKAGSIDVCKSSHGLPFDESIALEILREDEITIAINLHNGDYSGVSWGCDLTYDYVKINGEYRT